MLLLQIIRGTAAFVAGVVITLTLFLTSLTCAALGLPSNWAAKWWGWLGYWVEFRLLAGSSLETQFLGPQPLEDQPVVLFGTHPLDPALQAWVYAVNTKFPDRHFAPTARDDHPLSPGFKAIGGATFSTKNGPQARTKLREWLRGRSGKLLLTIFPDVHRWTLEWHHKLWAKAVRRGQTQLMLTLPWKEGGLQEIWHALPQAAYYRCVVCFDQPVWGWAGFFRVSGARLLIRYDRTYPPLNPTDFPRWFNDQVAGADQIAQAFQRH